MSLPVRLVRALAALNNEHPLTNPHLTGPEDQKREWLTGYSFAQKLSEIERACLRLAILESERSARAGAQ
jgi:hypothetical protein